MIRAPISTRWRIGLAIASIAVMLLGYSLLVARQKAKNPSDTTMPNARQLIDGVRRTFQPRVKVETVVDADGGERRVEQRTFFRSWFWTDSTATWGRLFLGLGIGVAMGVTIGMLMGCYTPVEAALRLPVDFLSKIPPTAMLAVFLVLVGSTGGRIYVAMIAFGIMPTLMQSVYLGAKKHVPQELIDKARTLGASQPDILGSVIFRQTLPMVLESVRLAVGPAMVYLIAAEWLLADVGFGYRLRLQNRLSDMAVVYQYLLILGLAGYAIDVGMRRLIAWLCPWYERGGA